MINNIELVKATIDDGKLLYDWAMDSEVRKNSFNSEKFSFESHINWLKKQLDNKDCDILLCKINGNLIGQTRLYYEKENALINYSVDCNHRGKGYAKLMIKEIISFVAINHPKIKYLEAEVKNDNIPSLKVFEGLGFKKEKLEDISKFKKNLIKRIYIRTDANETIATGHVMRCLSIADEAKKYNIETVFINADNDSTNLITERKYKNIILKTSWNNLDEELDKLVKLIKKENIEILLIDSYFITKHYMEELNKYTKTIYIDDLGKEIYKVNMLISYANNYQELKHEENYKDTKLLLGPTYMPIRKEFMNLSKKKINKNIETILIISGGTNKNNILEKLLDLLYKKYKIICILGKFAKEYDKLKAKYTQDTEILKNVDNISKYMKLSDLAISAGGSTLYELCACGTPTISYLIAENQLGNVTSFNSDNIILYAGDIEKDKICKNIENLIEKYNYEFRCKVSKQMREKVDGNGSKRIIEEIINL